MSRKKKKKANKSKENSLILESCPLQNIIIRKGMKNMLYTWPDMEEVINVEEIKKNNIWGK